MRVVFVCQFGGAKSVMAASWFNRLAAEQGLPFDAVAVAAEEPYDAVPDPVAELLAGDGFDVRAFRPRRAGAGELEEAARIVAIDCESGRENAERWDDVPKVSEDRDGSAAAIRRHVEALVKELRGGD